MPISNKQIINITIFCLIPIIVNIGRWLIWIPENGGTPENHLASLFYALCDIFCVTIFLLPFSIFYWLARLREIRFSGILLILVIILLEWPAIIVFALPYFKSAKYIGF